MHKIRGVAGFLGERVASAVEETLVLYRDGHIEEEGDITATLAQNLRNAVNDQVRNGVHFTGFVLPHSGPESDEKKVGADLAGILRINLPGANHSKLFLAQGKRANSGIIPSGGLPRLVRQCVDMLEITSASYVILYEKDGIFVADAASVAQSAHAAMERHESLPIRERNYYKPLPRFLEEVYKTFLGDWRIAPIVNSLDDLRRVAEQVRAKRAVAIVAKRERQTDELN